MMSSEFEKGYERLQRLISSIEVLVRGKRSAIELACCALLAEGHLLIEDAPGLGKTTLARAISHALDLGVQRIQMTSDLLPSDLLGVSIYDQAEAGFRFHPGPIFSPLVLADELNRASPRTQSALLEAMGEKGVTVDGQSYPLPAPFFVIATQNPLEIHGTYPLPENQLDRFLLKIELGYLDASVERALLLERRHLDPFDDLSESPPKMDLDSLVSLQQLCRQVHVDESLVDYLLHLAIATRESSSFVRGVSTRACLSTLHVAKANALVRSRDYLLADDIEAVLVAAWGHRVRLRDAQLERGQGQVALALQQVMASVQRPA